MAVAYVLLPSSHDFLVPGVPLSMAGAGLLIVVWAAFAIRERPIGRGSLAFVALLLALKVAGLAWLPQRGFEGAYYPNENFEGEPYTRTDPALDFDYWTFPRNFFNEIPLTNRSYERYKFPFSVVWRGRLALRQPAVVVVERSATEPVTVTVDGQEPSTQPISGVHDIEVRFARREPTLLALRVSVGARSPQSDAIEPVTVWRTGVTTGTAMASETYAVLASALGLLFLAWLIWSFAADLRAILAGPWPARRVPPFAIAALGVVAFWFVLGALRVGAQFSEMDFLGFGDDWIAYEDTARRIVAGNLGGEKGAVFPATFLFPYFVAVLHVVFGEFTRPLYFNQHVMIGVTAVLAGLFARGLWGERMGIAVLVTTCLLGLADMYRNYLTRLLSENLMVPLAPLMFLAIHASLKRPARWRAFLAGALLGATALARFNLLPFVAVATAYLAFRPMTGDRRVERQTRVALVAGCALFFGLFPLREFLVTGVARALPWQSTMINYVTYEGSFVDYFQKGGWTAPITKIILPNVFFVLGYPKFSVPYYSVRPHWMLMWVAYLAWIWRHRHTPTPPMVWVLHLFILMNVAVLVPYGFVGIYGFRYLLPLVFGVGLFMPGGLYALSEIVTAAWRRRLA